MKLLLPPSLSNHLRQYSSSFQVLTLRGHRQYEIIPLLITISSPQRIEARNRSFARSNLTKSDQICSTPYSSTLLHFRITRSKTSLTCYNALRGA